MIRYPAKKICVIRTSAIGDVVNALTLVNGLRHGYPQAQITWITQNIPGQVLKEQRSIDELITFKRKMSMSQWGSFLKSLRATDYDILLVPQVSVKASIIASVIRSPIKIGYDFRRAREMSWLVTNRRIPAKKPGHVVDQYLEFVDYLGISCTQPEWGITFSDDELDWRDHWIRQFKNPILALVPASSTIEKDWPVENYVKLIDIVCAQHALAPVIVGGPGRRERELAESILARCQIKPVLALEKPVRHTLLQLSCARVVVAPDTGPLHMAVALNVPTVGLYGFSNPNRCGPYHFRELIIDKFNPVTGPALPITRKTMPDRMKLITPEEVLSRIKRALSLSYEPFYPLK